VEEIFIRVDAERESRRNCYPHSTRKLAGHQYVSDRKVRRLQLWHSLVGTAVWTTSFLWR